MSKSVTIETHSESNDKDSFNKIFAQLPESARNAVGAAHLVPPANLWIQLIHYGELRQSEFWIARSRLTHEAVARIGADVPVSRHLAGSIGFFECVDSTEGRQAGVELLGVAQQWLVERGVKTAVGPMDFNSWFNYRFKLREAGSSQSEDRAWEPNAPDFHLELFRTTGFIDSIHFSSMFFEVPTPAVWDQYLNLLAPDHQKVVDAGFTLRPFKHGHERLEDLKLIFEISNQAFKDNPMFEQIPFEIFAAMTLASAQKSNISGSRLCFAPDSSPAGFMFAFFEQSEVICKTVAVLPEYRALGLANAMSYQLSQDSRLAGMNKSVGALIRAGNTSENIGRKHSRIASQMRENRYVLLAKELA